MDWSERLAEVERFDTGVKCAELWDGIRAAIKRCDRESDYGTPTVPRDQLEYWVDVTQLIWDDVTDSQQRHVEGVPRHYRGDGKITCSDAMRSMMRHGEVKGLKSKRLTPTAIMWWALAFRYLWRWAQKGAPVSDLDKLIDCAEKLKVEIAPTAKQD